MAPAFGSGHGADPAPWFRVSGSCRVNKTALTQLEAGDRQRVEAGLSDKVHSRRCPRQQRPSRAFGAFRAFGASFFPVAGSNRRMTLCQSHL